MHVPANTVVIILLYSGLAITGLLGNIWVLLTVSTQLFGCISPARAARPALQSSAYIYLLLLSVVDLISLLPVPMIVTDLYVNRFPFGNNLCRLIYICEATNKTLSPLVLTALSIDRYIAICKPNLQWMRQTRFALFLIALFFLASLFFIVPIAMLCEVREMIDNNGVSVMKCAMFHHSLLDTFQVVTCYFAPLTIIVLVYLAIMSKLYRHTRYSSVGRKTTINLSRVLKCSVMVVAFYFICWTPYWTLRLYAFIAELVPEAAYNATEDFDVVENIGNVVLAEVNTTMETREEAVFFDDIFWMYIVHAFPYAESAFNWLFYAFLNRNLRNSSGRSANVVRSAPATSTLLENGNSASQGRSPLWRNLQQMGTQLRSAGVDTGHALLKMSPFRTRSAGQSRNSVCVDGVFGDSLAPCSAPINTLMLDIQQNFSSLNKCDLKSGKAQSFGEIPPLHLIEPNDGESRTSDNSSVEWL